MEDLKEIKHLQQLLAEAIEMLDDVRHKFGMFENQKYQKFKAELNDYNKELEEICK